MPALRRYSPSVAPVSITGTTGMFQSRFVTRSLGSVMAGVSGDGGLGIAAVTTLTLTAVSATTLLNVFCTSSHGAPASIRQLTDPDPVSGNAFPAYPPNHPVPTR